MKQYCLTLDLKDDPSLIAEYERMHQQVWPEIIKSIRHSGILKMEIYRFSNRLTMIIEAEDHFSFARKAELDVSNPKVMEWEDLMWKYQQAVPGSQPGEKWVLMEKIFDFQG